MFKISTVSFIIEISTASSFWLMAVSFSQWPCSMGEKGSKLCWTCENILKFLLVVIFLLILCLAIAGATEAHWMEIARGLFITIIVCCCVSCVLSIFILLIKHRKQVIRHLVYIFVLYSIALFPEWMSNVLVSFKYNGLGRFATALESSQWLAKVHKGL